ncbi:hypothetical protein DH2020_043293 [Rehmannia glutinosa]|uniref:Shikimate dehydrogenase n=1 Tax=Rehmannia glutinosa TaxID=99300 RepID=A0ABR0ULR1_REHGL
MESGVGMRKNQTLICAPLMADTVDQLVELMHKAKLKGADIVEIRLDHLKSFNPQGDIEKLIKECPLPTLFTYRPVWEGGQYDGDENSRFDALRLAMELGADHIDIELKVPFYPEFENIQDCLWKGVCPGQPTIEELVSLYNFRLMDSDTKVFGIIGKPVSHSKSPKLYNRAFKEDGVNGVFVHLLVDDVPKFFETYSSSDFSGFSCTIPHKEVALTCCDEVDPVAKVVGSQHGASGIGSPLAGKLFIVIGAGGAGRALAYGAKEKGARVVIANRTYDRARELAELVGGQALSLAELDSFHPETGMILANTTSIGMQPKVEETPVSKEALKYYELVFDAVYTPKITRLLREAEEVGAKIVTGVEMFIGQAYEQYERFTGLPAPKQLFKEIMKDY